LYIERVSLYELPVLSPRERQSSLCSSPVVDLRLSATDANELATIAKALADSTRLQIVDVLRIAAPEAICQCELTPLFSISQQAMSKHLGVLVAAGILGSERRGVWTYYHVHPAGLERIAAWLA
jgi:ArsR family transcriptional regulator